MRGAGALTNRNGKRARSATVFNSCAKSVGFAASVTPKTTPLPGAGFSPADWLSALLPAGTRPSLAYHKMLALQRDIIEDVHSRGAHFLAACRTDIHVHLIQIGHFGRV